MDLKIVELIGLQFNGANSARFTLTGGYGLYSKEKGYVSFKGENEKYGVKTPYVATPNALHELLDAGGLTDDNTVEWLESCN